MPLVTDIKRQKRSESRYSIYIDGTYAFALSDLDLSTSGLRVGRELSLEEVESYKHSSEAAKVYALALRYLSIRDRSYGEMADYLQRKEIPPAQIEATLERLLQDRFLDDRRFAASWIANRQLLRVRSRRKLQQELMLKGVPSDIIGEALQELDPEDELATLIDLIERKSRQTSYQDEQKLMAYLGRQGYSYGLVKQALERINEK